MRIDLHAHSNVSDGTQPPAGLLTAAAQAGLDVLGLTDHDSTDGWAAAIDAASHHGVGLLPGMEISCKTSQGVSVHLLCYLHDPFHAGLLAEITKAKDARQTRAERMVQRTEVVKAAEHRARRIVDGAEAEARRLRLECEDYCDQKLATFEIVLERTMKVVMAGRDKLQASNLDRHDPLDQPTVEHRERDHQ